MPPPSAPRRADLTSSGRPAPALRFPATPTDHSSLSYLENLPVDILKIDKSIVDRIGEASAVPGPDHAPQESVMVSAISQLGHALHLLLVAEGIEVREQVSALRTLACAWTPAQKFAGVLGAVYLVVAVAVAGFAVNPLHN